MIRSFAFIDATLVQARSAAHAGRITRERIASDARTRVTATVARCGIGSALLERGEPKNETAVVHAASHSHPNVMAGASANFRVAGVSLLGVARVLTQTRGGALHT